MEMKSFLEVEIDFLSNAFDEVLIITKHSASENIRDVPENVSVITKRFTISLLKNFKS